MYYFTVHRDSKQLSIREVKDGVAKMTKMSSQLVCQADGIAMIAVLFVNIQNFHRALDI